MSHAWNMFNIWPCWVTSTLLLIFGTRCTMVSFVYLTCIGGHCLVSYCMELGWLIDSHLRHPVLKRSLSSIADTQSSATMGMSLEHNVFLYNTYTKYWYYKKVRQKSRWNFAEGLFSKRNSNLQTHELVLDNRLHYW